MTLDQLLNHFANAAKDDDRAHMRMFYDVLTKRFHDAERLALLQAAATLATTTMNESLDLCVMGARKLLGHVDEQLEPVEDRAEQRAKLVELRVAHGRGYMAGRRSMGTSAAFSADIEAAADQDYPYPPEENAPDSEEPPP